MNDTSEELISALERDGITYAAANVCLVGLREAAAATPNQFIRLVVRRLLFAEQKINAETVSGHLLEIANFADRLSAELQESGNESKKH